MIRSTFPLDRFPPGTDSLGRILSVRFSRSDSLGPILSVRFSRYPGTTHLGTLSTLYGALRMEARLPAPRLEGDPSAWRFSRGGAGSRNGYPTRASKPLHTGDLSPSALRMQALKAHEIVLNEASSGWEEVSDWRLINKRQFQKFHDVNASLAALALGQKVR
jgi:hypothetical protein